MAVTESIYSRGQYATVDIGAQMRFGHPDIAEGDAVIVQKVTRLQREAGRPLRILEVGSGSGYLVELLHQAMPDAQLIANEFEPALVALARNRFAGTSVTIFDRSFEEWHEPLDVLISWGAHHHLTSPSHLQHAARLLGAAGVLLLGDEFCPDYLEAEDRARIDSAEIVFLAKGHVLTTQMEVASFRASGDIPEWSRRLEQRRRRALWEWYKYVVDYAMARGDDLVVEAELHIAADDLNTSFSDEHKLALAIVRRDLELHGFIERSAISLRSEPSLASFAIMELTAKARS